MPNLGGTDWRADLWLGCGRHAFPIQKFLGLGFQSRLRALQTAAGFAITTAPVPDLDLTNLVVGRIVSGAALVDDLAAMPAVKATHSNPFFK